MRDGPGQAAQGGPGAGSLRQRLRDRPGMRCGVRACPRRRCHPQTLQLRVLQEHGLINSAQDAFKLTE